jgi:transposase
VKKQVKTKYNTEFRERAVRMVISSDKSTAQIAKDLGIKTTTLYSWVNKTKSADVPRTEQSNEQMFDELVRLKKELAEVKEQRDILKKATAYFAKESL